MGHQLEMMLLLSVFLLIERRFSVIKLRILFFVVVFFVICKKF